MTHWASAMRGWPHRTVSHSPTPLRSYAPRQRVLLEAGRAAHLDYAAPAANMVAATARGGVMAVRGTSFAVPLVAATIARGYPSPDPAQRAAALQRVDAAAEPRGKRYGRGWYAALAPRRADRRWFAGLNRARRPFSRGHKGDKHHEDVPARHRHHRAPPRRPRGGAAAGRRCRRRPRRQIGGGTIGGMGIVGGMATGTLDSTRRLSVDSAAARARQQERQERRLANRERRVGGSASLDGAARTGDRSFAADTTASGELAFTAAPGTTRGALAATRSGLRQTGTTASGIAVFAPATAVSLAAPAAPVGVAVTRYPAYSRGIYYGPGAVFVGGGEAYGYIDRQYVDLSDDLRGTGAIVERRGNALVVQLPADITFAYDKADIRPQFYGVLNVLAQSLADYPASDVEVIGHTDARGSDAYNLALSDRRGRSVADFLVARRTDPHRLVVEAMGETQPLDTNATVAGRAANRRVEFVIHPRVRG